MSQVCYCLTHESWGEVLCEEMDGEPCIWVSCPPPNDRPLNWDEIINEPSPDELEKMDRNADSLMFDLLNVE